jgi:hypothetical protein
MRKTRKERKSPPKHTKRVETGTYSVIVETSSHCNTPPNSKYLFDKSGLNTIKKQKN